MAMHSNESKHITLAYQNMLCQTFEIVFFSTLLLRGWSCDRKPFTTLSFPLNIPGKETIFGEMPFHPGSRKMKDQNNYLPF